MSMKRLEAKFGASWGQGLNDPRHIVADEYKASDFAVGFHGASQGILSILQQWLPDTVKYVESQNVCPALLQERAQHPWQEIYASVCGLYALD